MMNQSQRSSTPTHAPHEENDQADHKDQSNHAAADRSTTKEKTASAEQDQKHNE